LPRSVRHALACPCNREPRDFQCSCRTRPIAARCSRGQVCRSYTAVRYNQLVDDAPEIVVLQLPKFKADATELIGTDGIEAVAAYLIDYPSAGDVMPGSGGVRKLRWAARSKGKRGGARVIYLYVAITARIYLLRCYAKNVKTDLTADERKALRHIAAHLKGVQ
jgi:RelE toxin of RelE / RelB toxin-antitoxin system